MAGKLVVGNWKMNLLREEAEKLSRSVAESLGDGFPSCEVVLAPPFTSLEAAGRGISGSNLQLAAQNAFGEIKGAFTGEVSPPMLVDAGCAWVILGHSERRHIMGETDAQISGKLVASLDCGLKAILCVGETGEQRKEALVSVAEGLSRKEALFGPTRIQIEKGLSALDEENAADVVVAYEPVWAIGTGKNATSMEISEIHGYIKELLIEMFPDSGGEMRILYGGSVSPANIEDIMSVPQVDGILVGGASLSADSFLEIIKSAGD